ncbi:regulatory protein [Mycobacterium lentiflavum]|uniref:Regulatory protein n=1 Tax=Mycobacterium lentiflavum TaxID=141349 RepID=A0A0E4CNP2_MYCLN|nr:LuxR family transcriptional regulator [Mycobacterium lentiflavum]CQD14949.1 regulatory protein [Mycobacterium lentiflavum]
MAAHEPRCVTALEVLPVRGRSRELAVIDTLVERLAGGRGSIVLIDGPPGIGKTRLLRECGERTVSHGGRLLSATATEHQRAVPFAPLFSATLAADPPVGDADALRALGSVTDLRYWVVRELQSAIAEAARATPLMIAIDDAHLADAGTVTALRLLMAALADAPVLWALTTRNGTCGAAIRDAVQALGAGGVAHAAHLLLPPVDVVAAAGIVSDILGSSVDDSLSQLAAQAMGNPFLVIELLHGLREDNRIHFAGGRASAIGPALPRRMVTTMEKRLDSLNPMTRELVGLASILPERFSVTLLARMLDRRPAELVGAITEAVRADLLIGDEELLKFRHDLLRSAARNTLPESLRRALERESADVLLDLGAVPEDVAPQLARSAEVGDLAAVASLRSAARSLARADCSGAADIALRALELAGCEPALRAALLAENVELLIRASRFDEAEAMAARALSGDLPPQAEADIRVSLSMLPTRWPQHRAAENRSVLTLPDLAPVTRARNQAWLASTMMLDGQLAAGPVAREALEQLARLDDVETETLAKTTVAAVELATGYGRRASAICDDVMAGSARLGASSSAGQAATRYCSMVLAALGRLEDATANVAVNRAVAEAERKTSTVQLLDMIQAMCDAAAGQLGQARAAFAPHVQTVGAHDYVVADVVALTHLALVAVHLDDKTLIRHTSSAARGVAQDGCTDSARVRARCVLVRAAWYRGDLTSAVRHLGQKAPLLPLPLWPTDFDNAVLTARLAAATGDEVAHRHAGMTLDVLERENPRAPLLSGVAQYVRGLLERDVASLAGAVNTLSTAERPMLHAAALEDLGQLLRDADQRDAAADTLSQAFDVYSAHGAVGDARRTARSLHDFGVSRRIVRTRAKTGWESLTPAELRVAELVIEGASNPEVAQRLSLSPHTVNTHLRHVYSKLGVNSRTELKRVAAVKRRPTRSTRQSSGLRAV